MDPPPITKWTRNRSSKVKKQNKKPHRKKDKNNNPNHKSNYVWLLLERRQSFITLLRSCWCSNLAVALVLFCRLPTTRGCLFNVQTKGFKMKIARYLLHRYPKCWWSISSPSSVRSDLRFAFSLPNLLTLLPLPRHLRANAMLYASASVLGVHATIACRGCRKVWIRSSRPVIENRPGYHPGSGYGIKMPAGSGYFSILGKKKPYPAQTLIARYLLLSSYSMVWFWDITCVSFFVKVWWLVSKKAHCHRLCIFPF